MESEQVSKEHYSMPAGFYRLEYAGHDSYRLKGSIVRIEIQTSEGVSDLGLHRLAWSALRHASFKAVKEIEDE